MRLIPACSVKGWPASHEILDVASIDIMRRLICLFGVRIWQKQVSHDVTHIILQKFKILKPFMVIIKIVSESKNCKIYF